MSEAPATASLSRAIGGLNGASEAAHDVVHAGIKLYKFNKAPDGSRVDVALYTSATASATHHIRRLLAETMTVRSVLVDNAKQSSPG